MRQNILDTGRRIVVAKGYAAGGINEVLAEASVPKGSFYYYFDSKDAFGEAMMKSYFDDYFTTVDDYFTTMDGIVGERDKSSAEHLVSYWHYFYDTQVANDCQGGCLVVKLGAEIADGVADGSVPVDRGPRATAEALDDLWLGASMMAKIHGSPDHLDRAMVVTREVLHV